MAILRIRTWGDPILKIRAQEVKEIDEDLRRLARDMMETMQFENGVGLAANQVGFAQRIFVAEVPAASGPGKTYVLINPVLKSKSKERETKEEGCLSFPGIFGPVDRHLEVEVAGLGLDNQPIVLKVSGLLARAFQHEMDHLDGMVFIERMPMVQRILLKRQLNDLSKHTRAALSGRDTPRI